MRACHERYDGTGYPDRLSGEQIPLESRIVLACDAFHAMTTDRPYRKSLGEEKRGGDSSRPPARSSTRRSSTRCCACSALSCRKTGIRLAPDTGREDP